MTLQAIVEDQKGKCIEVEGVVVSIFLVEQL